MWTVVGEQKARVFLRLAQHPHQDRHGNAAKAARYDGVQQVAVLGNDVSGADVSVGTVLGIVGDWRVVDGECHPGKKNKKKKKGKKKRVYQPMDRFGLRRRLGVVCADVCRRPRCRKGRLALPKVVVQRPAIVEFRKLHWERGNWPGMLVLASQQCQCLFDRVTNWPCLFPPLPLRMLSCAVRPDERRNRLLGAGAELTLRPRKLCSIRNRAGISRPPDDHRTHYGALKQPASHLERNQLLKPTSTAITSGSDCFDATAATATTTTTTTTTAGKQPTSDPSVHWRRVWGAV